VQVARDRSRSRSQVSNSVLVVMIRRT